jgi:hypothetical protein
MTTKRKAQNTATDKTPAAQTVSEVLEKRGVPLPVRFWLERYAGGDEHALELHGCDDDPATYEIARLVYDVLDTDSHVQFAAIDDNATHPHFPAEARDFIEEWMYHITHDDGMLNPWGNPEMAVAALSIALDPGAGPLIEYEKDPMLAVLRGAIKALTTKAERREFLRDTAETNAEPLKESDENWHAAFKLSRVLADPRTPADVRRQIQEHVIELCNAANVIVDHPALVRRAYLVACDQRPKGQVREVRTARRKLLALLD